MEQAIVSAVTHDLNEAKITIAGVPDTPGVAARLFRRLAEDNVNVDMIVQNTSTAGQTDISFTVPMTELELALKTCNAIGPEVNAREVSADDKIARVSVVGAGMKTSPGVAAKMFEVLAEANINIEMISTSTIRISCVIRGSDADKAVQVLHAAFGLEWR